MLVFIHRVNVDYVIAALSQMLQEVADADAAEAFIETIAELEKEAKAFDARPLNQRLRREKGHQL